MEKRSLAFVLAVFFAIFLAISLVSYLGQNSTNSTTYGLTANAVKSGANTTADTQDNELNMSDPLIAAALNDTGLDGYNITQAALDRIAHLGDNLYRNGSSLQVSGILPPFPFPQRAPVAGQGKLVAYYMFDSPSNAYVQASILPTSDAKTWTPMWINNRCLQAVCSYRAFTNKTLTNPSYCKGTNPFEIFRVAGAGGQYLQCDPATDPGCCNSINAQLINSPMFVTSLSHRIPNTRTYVFNASSYSNEGENGSIDFNRAKGFLLTSQAENPSPYQMVYNTNNPHNYAGGVEKNALRIMNFVPFNTVSFWIKPREVNRQQMLYQKLIDNAWGTTVYGATNAYQKEYFALYINADGSIGYRARLTDQTMQTSKSNAILQANQWYFVTMVLSGDTSGVKQTLYINGVKDSENVANGISSADILSNSMGNRFGSSGTRVVFDENSYIYTYVKGKPVYKYLKGNENFFAGYDSKSQYNGLMDELGMYNSGNTAALNDGDVASIYSSQKQFFAVGNVSSNVTQTNSTENKSISASSNVPLITAYQPSESSQVINKSQSVDFIISSCTGNGNLNYSWKVKGVPVASTQEYLFSAKYRNTGEYSVEGDCIDAQGNVGSIVFSVQVTNDVASNTSVTPGNSTYIPLVAPTGLTASSDSSSSALLSWDGNSNADWIEVWISMNKDSGWVTFDNINGNETSYVAENLNQNTTYYFKLVAYGAGVNNQTKVVSTHTKEDSYAAQNAPVLYYGASSSNDSANSESQQESNSSGSETVPDNSGKSTTEQTGSNKTLLIVIIILGILIILLIAYILFAKKDKNRGPSNANNISSNPMPPRFRPMPMQRMPMQRMPVRR